MTMHFCEELPAKMGSMGEVAMTSIWMRLIPSDVLKVSVALMLSRCLVGAVTVGVPIKALETPSKLRPPLKGSVARLSISNTAVSY